MEEAGAGEAVEDPGESQIEVQEEVQIGQVIEEVVQETQVTSSVVTSSVVTSSEMSSEVTEVISEEITTTESEQMESNLEQSSSLEVDMEAVEQPAAPEPVTEQETEEVTVDTTSQGPQVIQQENIKKQLNEIIQDLDNQVPPVPFEFDTTVKESDWHTWRPKGKYNIPKVESKFDDMKSELIPDIPLREIPEAAHEPEHKPTVAEQPVEMIDQFAPRPPPPPPTMSEKNTPILIIPMGIPLLARVLPNYNEEGDGPRESIPLERLFTPATDSGDITPRKKKMFSSSAFYGPNHPTIEDQVSLAQRISTSLIDENNCTSRGQSMYIKRKKRSVKWIHQVGVGIEDYAGDDDWVQANGEDGEEAVLSPVQEIKKLQTMRTEQSSSSQLHQLQQMAASGQQLFNPEIMVKPAAEMPSPTGKGAELFAKRKKRMDQFIVDESSVQKSSQHIQQQQSSIHSQTASQSSSSFKQTSMTSSSEVSQQSSSSSMTGAQYLRSTCTAIQPTVDSSVHGVAQEGANVYTAEVKVIQHATLPKNSTFEIPEDMPHHSILLDDMDSLSKEDKRKSFNFAAKGWGTYNNFYTPISFTAQT